jgi:hypothetical protein
LLVVLSIFLFVEIGKFFNASEWQSWFASYQSMLRSVLSVSSQADAVNVGTELTLTQASEAEWRATIRLARTLFGGSLTYGANHNDEAAIKWWDELDWIGEAKVCVSFLTVFLIVCIF